MKTIVAIFALLAWMGCTTEVGALAVSAAKSHQPAFFPGIALLMFWLLLVAVCAWKWRHNRRPAI